MQQLTNNRYAFVRIKHRLGKVRQPKVVKNYKLLTGNFLTIFYTTYLQRVHMYSVILETFKKFYSSSIYRPVHYNYCKLSFLLLPHVRGELLEIIPHLFKDVIFAV